MKTTGKILLAIVLPIVAAEIILQLSSFFGNPEDKYRDQILQKTVSIAHLVIRNPDRIKFFQPPNKVYLNADYKSEERLKEIFHETLGPVGLSASVTDVLHPESDEKFLISLNSLGFRGKERAAEKPPKTKRIFVLGSYKTFGIGVNDNETYPAHLERILNESNSKTRYEVWNAGRMSATAIVGLAHLKHNVLQYKPDLMILDYGFVDCKINRKMLNEVNQDFVTDSVERFLYHHLSSSKLWYLFLKKFTGSNGERLEGFSSVMNEMIRILQENKIPVIVVKGFNAWTELAPFYQNLNAKDVYLFDQVTHLSRQKIGPEEWENVPWLEEVPVEYRVKVQDFMFAPYKKNLFHLNKKGFESMSIGLADLIREKKLL